ncbi:MAG TPA: FAD-binding protein [Burkholderiales bacterium]|nr:FAD-binding protein [Burkholderiales bacterium]
MTDASPVPLSAHELRDAVRQNHPFDARRLNRVLRIDAESGLLEVQAGTPWRTIACALRPADADATRIGETLPAVGASIAWNAAGPDGRPTVGHVESMTLITPDGELRRASRTTHADLFALTIGGQGIFGALYSVTLRLDSLAQALEQAAAPEVRNGPQHGGALRRLQLILPAGSAEAFLAQAQAACEEWRIPLVRSEQRPVQAESETFLAWARRSCVQVSVWLGVPRTLGATVRVAQLCKALLDASLERGGSFSIAQTVEASREQVEAGYPGLRAFLAEKRKLDPAERISNAWYRHHRSLFARQACESRWNR